MRVNILGREFLFEVKERNKKNDESQSYIKNRFILRFVILAITFIIFVIII